MPVSKVNEIMIPEHEEMVLELLRIITRTELTTRNGNFTLTPPTIDKTWNILNAVCSIEGISMLHQINTFEKFIRKYGYV